VKKTLLSGLADKVSQMAGDGFIIEKEYVIFLSG
jgi:hypothetical protein